MRRSFLTGSITLCIITVSLLLSITAENPDIAVDQKEEDQVGSSSFKIHSKMFQVALKLRSASKQQENLIADVSKFNHSSNSDHSNLIDSEGNRTREVAHEISNSSKEEGTNDLLEKRDNETSVQTDGTEKAQQQQDTASEQDVLETDVEPVLELRNETSEKPMDTCVIEESGEDAENELDDSYEEGSTAETGTGHSKEGMPPLRQDDTPSSRDNPPSSQDDVQLNLRMTKGAEEPILRLRKPPYDFLLRCLRAEKVYQCVELKNLPAFQVSGLLGYMVYYSMYKIFERIVMGILPRTASKLLSVITAYFLSIPVQHAFHSSMRFFVETDFKPTFSRVFLISSLGLASSPFLFELFLAHDISQSSSFLLTAIVWFMYYNVLYLRI